ncbi:MAG: hypothetical protein IPM51_06285 [Sphingobacteriaceae bacterium]|nr:hypothetical protein [Sphingobacteriaceae bacterium]
MKNILIILSVFGILLSVAQFIPDFYDLEEKVESFKTEKDSEEKSDSDVEDYDFLKLFDSTCRNLIQFQDLISIKQHLNFFDEYKNQNIYFQIVTPPPEV